MEGASTARIEISRRIIDQNATDATNRLAETFTVNIENGLGAGKEKEFLLKPYDLVQVRKSPAYTVQETMNLNGEILFPGNYVIESRNERISDIVKRAGGLLESAYIKGAYLKRRLTQDQRELINETMRLARSHNQSEDSIIVDQSTMTTTFYVGIDLQRALENPGCTQDFIVQPGDQVFVPEHQSTVKITGDVLFPNTVVYEPGKKLKYNIAQAGGYGDRARKKNTYIVYMNGTVAKAKGNVAIEPGCQIIVPTKPESNPFDWSKVLAMATTLGSIASMTAAVVAVFKK